jgi:hypothetical protein
VPFQSTAEQFDRQQQRQQRARGHSKTLLSRQRHCRSIRETLPLLNLNLNLNLNLTEHAENPRGLLFLAQSVSDTTLPMGLLTGALAGGPADRRWVFHRHMPVERLWMGFADPGTRTRGGDHSVRGGLADVARAVEVAQMVVEGVASLTNIRSRRKA